MEYKALQDANVSSDQSEMASLRARLDAADMRAAHGATAPSEEKVDTRTPEEIEEAKTRMATARAGIGNKT